MKLVNLTPHAIVIRLADGTDRTIPPSGQTVRCQVRTEQLEPLDGISVVRSAFGDLEGLPAPEEGTVFITSTPAAQKAAVLGRTDVVSPDTGPTAIRENGQVKAVRGFQRF